MLPDKKIKAILKQRKLAPKKRFGQNFLVNDNISEKIVRLAGIEPDDTIIELGVGFGALTGHLARCCKKVIGLEIDSGIVRWHQEEGRLPGNVTLVHQDILAADFNMLAREVGGRLKIIANLPYSISNPLLFKLADHGNRMEWAVLMLQKEVAQRLSADSGTKEYGILTVRMAASASVHKILDLGPQHFHPRPKVDSQVIKIIFHPEPERVKALPDYDLKAFKTIVDAAFQQRRKTLVNALSASAQLNLAKKSIEAALDEMRFDRRIRGEKLSVEDFVALTNILQSYLRS
ncbi:MAG: ribosomal RNA small subunit methyltransferase A [Deltaproteobacteria bacterium]|jgi:16S rRNA (adenine1518-N6/adenine1519-N6)-dimethyltransferase|nr:ribosomal RNA small subunit methyltransferase A [Deltaproteobacteria bacterium]